MVVETPRDIARVVSPVTDENAGHVLRQF